MPRQKSVRTIIAETLMLFGMAVVVGHMATNFWGRFMLQSELTNMKTSLYTLKDAVNNIGTAYDNLYKELQCIAIEDKATYKPETGKLPTTSSSALTKQDQEVQSQAKVQAQAEVQAQNMLDISTTFEKAVEDFMQQCKAQPVSNISTSRSCPINSLLEKHHYDKLPKKLSSCIHRCYNWSISDELFYPASEI